MSENELKKYHHFKMKTSDGIELDLIETKYYEELLDLYNKEKEKNMQLNEKNIIYKNSIPNQSNFYNFSNYISKDKIRAKIEEVKRKREEEWETAGISMLGSAIDVLTELLEEE